MISTTGNTASNLHNKDVPISAKAPTPLLKYSIRNERGLLKTFLLGNLYQLFCEQFQYNNHDTEGSYEMDSKIIQFLIQGIIETGEYTLEGIAYHTRIPFDVIYDAACGINHQFSVIPWAKIADLYTQVRPDIVNILINKLLEMKSKEKRALSILLTET